MDTKHFKRLIFILLDGAPYSVFTELVDDGTLYNIKKYIIDRGTFKRFTTVFPSVTGPSYIPFIMGLYPGTADVPGIRWMCKQDFQDTNSLLNPGICSYMGLDSFKFNAHLPHCPSLFQFFSSVSNVWNFATGEYLWKKNQHRCLSALIYGYSRYSKNWTNFHNLVKNKFLKAVQSDNSLVYCVYPTIDSISHISHPKSDAVMYSYKYFDQMIGEACNLLTKKNELDDTLIIIVSDHGQTRTHTHIDLDAFLDKQGWKCLSYPVIWRQDAKSANMVSGNAMSHLYFKNNGYWGERCFLRDLTYTGLTESILELEGIDFVAGLREDNTVIVKKKGGEGYISTTNNEFSYYFIGDDPLGYKHSFKSLTSTEVLAQTFNTSYPDGIAQLWQIFQSKRTGDLIVSAKEGYDLRARFEFPEHHSSHGALFAAHMNVPFAANLQINTEFARTVDIFPTILKCFGHQIDDLIIDGKILC